MRLVQTIRNIFKIEDLRARLLYTLAIIALYRLGKYITLPGIDPAQLGALKSQTSSGLMGLLDMFSGGAFSQASVFALGIMPYISASIVVQLLGIVFPYFQKLQKGGKRKKKNEPVYKISYCRCSYSSGSHIPCKPYCSASSFSLCSGKRILL